MSDGWSKVLLGDIAQIFSGSREKGGAASQGVMSIGGEQISADGRIRFEKMKFVSQEHFDQMRSGRLARGDTLLVKDGATTGKVGLWDGDEDAAVNEHVFILRANEPECLPYFLLLIAQSDQLQVPLREQIRGIIGGVTRGIANIDLRLPPAPVQRRIVDLLEHLDCQIAALRAEEVACRSVLNRLRGKSWNADEVLLETIITGIEGGFSVRAAGDEPDTEQARILKVSAVRPGSFQPHESKALNANAEMPDRALVSVGDLLITRSNTPDRVGYCARARIVPPRTFFPDLVWRLSLDEATCDPDFFEQVLASDTVRDRITATASGTSASMRKINRAGLRSVSIPLPTLVEQRDFAETCLSAARTAESLSEEVAAISQLRAQLLASLLSEEIEIPDSYDALFNVGVAS